MRRISMAVRFLRRWIGRALFAMCVLVMLLVLVGWFRSSRKHYDYMVVYVARLRVATMSSESKIMLGWDLADSPAQQRFKFKHSPGVPIATFLWLNIVGDNAPDYEWGWRDFLFLRMRGITVLVAPDW